MQKSSPSQPLRWFRRALPVLCALALTACGGDGGSSPPAGSYSVGGTVSGLAGTGLVLQDTSAGSASVAANGAFSLPTPLASGANYNVVVATQPGSPAQTCTVANGSGTVGSANVGNIAVTCVSMAARFAYVANSKANTISIFSVDAGTGQLTATGSVATGVEPRDIAVTPNGQFAYVANFDDGTISGYSIGNGALTSLGAATPAGTHPVAIAIAPSGLFAYVANAGSKNVSAYAIDANGGLTAVAGSPFASGTGPLDIAIDAAGKFAYVPNQGDGNVSAFAIDATTGALSAIGGSPFTAGAGPYAVALDNTAAYAYVANSAANTLSSFSVDAASGALTPLPVGASVPSGNTPFSIAIEPTAKYAYVANSNGHDVTAYAINANGSLTAIESKSTGVQTTPYSVTVDPSGQFIYVANYNSGNVAAFAIDPGTGKLTEVAGSPFPSGAGAAAVVTVP